MLTDATAKRIIEVIRLGEDFGLARKVVGVSATVANKWRKYAREGKEPFASFMNVEVPQAEAEAAAYLDGLIRDYASKKRRGTLVGDWRAAAYLRDRLDKRKPTRVELTGKDGEPLIPPSPRAEVEAKLATIAAKLKREAESDAAAG